jgi:hypothetical protein
MQQPARDFNNVLYKIKFIVNTYCEDIILKSNWQKQLEWFRQYDRDYSTKYWNLAPEVILQTKWAKLAEVINHFISDTKIDSDWEQMIVDLFMAKYDGRDLPNIHDILRSDSVQHVPWYP